MDYPFCDIHTHGNACCGLRLRSYSFTDADFDSRVSQMPYSVGVHPWHADEKRAGEWIALLASEPAAAIGEIGLDYACRTDRDIQRDVFVRQLDIARKRRLAVVLHVVRAFEPVMDILKGYDDLPSVVLHGFIGSPEQARQALAKGYFLSFGERAFASPKTLAALRETPLSQLFLETDDSPVPIEEIYARAAEARGVPTEVLQRATLANYERIFETRHG